MKTITINGLVKLRTIIQKALEIWCFICCTTILLIILYQVAARYLFHQPLVWAQGTCQLLMIHIVFLGAAMAFVTKSHLAIDIVVARLPKKILRVINLSSTLFVDVLLAFYSFCLYKILLSSLGSYPNPTVPMWFFYLPVFIGAVMAWIIVSINFMEDLFNPSLDQEREHNA